MIPEVICAENYIFRESNSAELFYSFFLHFTYCFYQYKPSFCLHFSQRIAYDKLSPAEGTLEGWNMDIYRFQ